MPHFFFKIGEEIMVSCLNMIYDMGFALARVVMPLDSSIFYAERVYEQS